MSDGQLDALLDSISAASQNQEGVPSYREVEKKLAAALRKGDKEAEGSAHYDLGLILASNARVIAIFGGDYLGISVSDHDVLLTRATGHFSAAYDAALTVGDDRTARWALLQLGDCHMQAGRERQARQLLELALHGSQPGGDVVFRSQLLSKLGDCALVLGDDGKAFEWYQAALELAVELGDPGEEATYHGKVASAYFNLERFDLALEHYRQARDLFVHIRDDPAFRERIIFNRNLIEQTRAEPSINYTDRMIETASVRLRWAEELPRRELVRARHAGYYLSQLNRVRDLYESDDARERSASLEKLDQEWGQISQGQRWTGAHATEYALAGEQGIGYALRAGSDLLSSRVPAEERQRWALPGLAVAERNEDREAQCDIHISLAYANVELGNPQTAEQHIEQAQRLARELRDSKREGFALIALSELCSKTGRYETAYTAVQDGRRLISEQGGTADKYLANQVAVYISAGNFREGLELAQRDLDEASRNRDIRRQAKAFGNLGSCLQRMGDNEAAVENSDRAVTLFRQLGDRHGEMGNLANAVAAHLDLRQYDQAQRCLQEALSIARELDDKLSEEGALGNLALTLRAIGRYDDALRNFEAVREMARRRNDQPGEAQALDGMGGVNLAQERYQEALECYERSTEVARQSGNQAMQAASMAGMGQVALLTGNAQDAIRLLSDARDLAQRAGARGFEANALLGLACAFGQAGRSRDGLKAAHEAREIAAALKDQLKLVALDILMATLERDLQILEDHGTQACGYLLVKGVAFFRPITEPVTGPIPDNVVALAEGKLPRLRPLLDQSQPEAYQKLRTYIRAAANAVLQEPTVARLLASNDFSDPKSDAVAIALGMRVAIVAVAMFG